MANFQNLFTLKKTWHTCSSQQKSSKKSFKIKRTFSESCAGTKLGSVSELGQVDPPRFARHPDKIKVWAKTYDLFIIVMHIVHNFEIIHFYTFVFSLRPTSVIDAFTIVCGDRAFRTFFKVDDGHSDFTAHFFCTPAETIRRNMSQNLHSDHFSHLHISRTPYNHICSYALGPSQCSAKLQSPHFRQLQCQVHLQLRSCRPHNSLCLYNPHGPRRLISTCSTRGKNHPRRPCRPRCLHRQRRPHLLKGVRCSPRSLRLPCPQSHHRPNLPLHPPQPLR